LADPGFKAPVLPGPFCFVMPGLVPGIHVFMVRNTQDVDGRDEPGHDVVSNET
jgi:hypothetical protein